VDGARYVVARKSLERKERYIGKGTLLSKQSVINYYPIAIKITSFLQHARKMRGMKFHENPSSVRRDTDEKTLSFPSKVPLIVPIRDQTYVAFSA